MTPLFGRGELPPWVYVVGLVAAWIAGRALVLWLFVPTRDTSSEIPK